MEEAHLFLDKCWALILKKSPYYKCVELKTMESIVDETFSSISPKAKIGQFLVCFLDILGQKNKLAELEKLHENKNVKFIGEYVKSIKVIHTFRGHFSTFYKSLNKKRDNPDFEASSYKDLCDLFQTIEISTQGFSDTVISYVDLTSQEHSIPIVSVHSALIGASGAAFISKVSKVVIRGGIEIGLGGEIFPNQIYGPVLNRAYKLESELAVYPRILIGNELIDYLKFCQTLTLTEISQQYSISDEVSRAYYIKKICELAEKDVTMANKVISLINTLANETQKFLFEDVDCKMCLDYLCEYFARVEGMKGFFESNLDFIEEQKSVFKKNNCPREEEKYSFLENYYLSRKKYWQEKTGV